MRDWLRLNAGKSQADAAAQFKVSQSSISKGLKKLEKQTAAARQEGRSMKTALARTSSKSADLAPIDQLVHREFKVLRKDEEPVNAAALRSSCLIYIRRACEPDNPTLYGVEDISLIRPEVVQESHSLHEHYFGENGVYHGRKWAAAALQSEPASADAGHCDGGTAEGDGEEDVPWTEEDLREAMADFRNKYKAGTSWYDGFQRRYAVCAIDNATAAGDDGGPAVTVIDDEPVGEAPASSCCCRSWRLRGVLLRLETGGVGGVELAEEEEELLANTLASSRRASARTRQPQRAGRGKRGREVRDSTAAATDGSVTDDTTDGAPLDGGRPKRRRRGRAIRSSRRRRGRSATELSSTSDEEEEDDDWQTASESEKPTAKKGLDDDEEEVGVEIDVEDNHR